MRRPMIVAVPLLLVVLACSVNVASAQGVPTLSGGGLTATILPENGGPASAGALRSLSSGTDVLVARRWLVESTAPVQRSSIRPAFKARRASTRRNPIWVP